MYLSTALSAGMLSAGYFVARGFTENLGYTVLGGFILIACLLAFFGSWDASALQAEIQAEIERGTGFQSNVATERRKYGC